MDKPWKEEISQKDQALENQTACNAFNKGVADETGMPNVENNHSKDVDNTADTDLSGDEGNVMGAVGTDRQGNMPPASGGG